MAGRGFKAYMSRYYRYYIIGGLFVALLVVLIVVWARGSRKETDEEDNESTIPELETTVEVPKDKYEENAYDDVNSLVASYLGAMSTGDTETMASLSSSLSDDMKAFYEAQAKYVGNYSNYNVYTKKGPAENSYFLLATYDLTINGQSKSLPALISLYVCRNESGALYINSESLTADEEAYILELVAQKDFAELINKIEMDYNSALEDDSSLAAAANALKDEINKDAQEILVAKQQKDLEEAAEAEAAAQAEALAAASSQVRCTSENVNIRASASTDAESIGKTKTGDIYTRYEKMENGWSKIDYNGKEAYIKSEFLEDVEDTSSSESTSEGGEESAASSLKPGDKITVKENVNVRKSASESGEKIATAYRGEQFELIELSNGWCKIKYKGEEAFVKADYVE
ncbi:MAG: SH3 domain-containing protein [Lachnospiraceae bacterium]|nr:SH3 domain-containing protein [Lachnospiraceae bacterium]